MKKIYSLNLLILCFLIQSNLICQVFTDSNLPIVIIDTENGATIPDEPKIGANLKIIYRGEGLRNYLTDQNNSNFLNYNGRIGIEVRGSTSANQPQKPFGIETRLADNITSNNVSLLGMPSENDWILLANYIDKSLIRNYLAYKNSRDIGQYASRGKYCEVILNGIYQGLYILEEKVKRDKNRIDITEMLETDNNLPNVSGGYILQEDDGGIITNPHEQNTANNSLIIEEPNFPSPSKVNFLQNYFNAIDTSTLVADPANFVDGFPSLIDCYSFFDYILVNELFNNTDAYGRSTFYHIDRNGKLIFGPVWDFDLAAGNVNQFGGTNPDHWEIKTGFYQGPSFLARIFDNPKFRCHIAKRWQELRQQNKPFNTTRINTIIDSLTISLAEAKDRHFTKWPVLGFCTALDPPGCELRTSHQDEIDYLKQFLDAKALWMDANILTGYTPCSYPTTPSLVINEIMYNPFFVATNNVNKSGKIASTNAIAEDYEFIEIKNNSTNSIDLTGVYFRGSGIVYQFPPNSNIAAGAIIVLASNIFEFQNRYGFAPFGQFTRDLANFGEKLVLADGMGNVIDQVIFTNLSPWPNAYGKSLELKTSNLDNSLAENWFQQTINGGSPGSENIYVAPNPCAILPKIVINEINYNSLTNVPPSITNTSDWIEIYNAETVPVNISGWFFKDATNTFVIPANTILAANDYLVICQNVANFSAVNSTNTKYLNVSTGIGLASAGENVSISDQNNCLVDQLTYGSVNPWPTSPNGQGFTLSLKSPNLNNSLGANWAASTAILGTPGVINFLNEAPLPVKLISFEAVSVVNGNEIKWKVVDEIYINKYEIEWSLNSNIFVKIGEIFEAKNEKYSFLHDEVNLETAFYRLKIIEKDGSWFYSKIVAVKSVLNNEIKVYPNPTSENLTITFTDKHLDNNILTLKVIDNLGKIVIYKNGIPKNNPTILETDGLYNGKYFLQIISKNGTKYLPFLVIK